MLAGVDLFARLTDEQRREIAAATATHRVRRRRSDRPAGRAGAVDVRRLLGPASRWSSSPSSRQVATIERGGYFGEMSLLTGEPRTATVVARGDTTVLEIDADVFRSLGSADPQAVEQIVRRCRDRGAPSSIRRAMQAKAGGDEAPATLLDADATRFSGC